MFILTIDSDDPATVKKVLKELCEERMDSNATGELRLSSTVYEYDFLTKQPWVAMAYFLQFNEDGNTLKTSGIQ